MSMAGPPLEGGSFRYANKTRGLARAWTWAGSDSRATGAAEPNRTESLKAVTTAAGTPKRPRFSVRALSRGHLHARMVRSNLTIL